MLNFANYKTIVIKVGSALLFDHKKKKPNSVFLNNLAKDIKTLKKMGINVIIVSSGAIASACHELNLQRKNISLDRLQALAAYGQILLIEHYKKQFSKYNLNLGQMLITNDNCQNRRHYLNMRATLNNLLELDIIPIVNENDSIITDEIKFGDNDNLSAQLAQLSNADLLIILSDVSGLYEQNPKINKNAKLITNISNITSKITNMAKEKETNDFGTGGMFSKIQAAKIATNSGTDVVITKGEKNNVIIGLSNDKSYSIFHKKNIHVSARKKWLSNLKTKAKIIIDDGAAKALKNNNSLLPVGVIDFQGEFKRGDTVAIISKKQQKIALGLSNISHIELKNIMGKNSKNINQYINTPNRNIVVHYDNMVLTN